MRLPKTLNIHVGKKLNDKLKEDITKEVFKALNLYGVVAIQVAYEVIRVTFLTDEGFRRAKELTGVRLFGLWCPILGGGPPVTIVHVFDYPYEEDNGCVFTVFNDFGDVKKVKDQTCLWNSSVFTGTRLVFMVLNSNLPRGLTINGYSCRVWYKGQPLICNLCNVQGHKSAVCPNKDKCRRCGEQGHFARTCSKNLNPSPAFSGEDPVVSSVPSGEGTGNDPSPGSVVSAEEGTNASVAGVQSDVGVQNASVQNVQNDVGMQNEGVQNDVGMLNENVQTDESMQNVQNDEDLPNESVQKDVGAFGIQNETRDDGVHGMDVQNAECVQNNVQSDVQSGIQNELTCLSVVGDNASACDQEHDFNSDLGDEIDAFEEDMDDLEGIGSFDADETPSSDVGGSPNKSSAGPAEPVEKESEVSTKHDGSGSGSAASSSYASVVQGHSDSLVDAPRTCSSEGSIMKFSESSESQSILGPKVPPVTYGSRNLQGKAKSSVISKLLPRKQPVVRSGHHALPVVVSNRPSLGAKTKKR